MIRYRRATIEDCDLLHEMLVEMASAEGNTIKGSAETLRTHGFGPSPRFRAVLAEAMLPLGFCLFLPEYSSWRGEMGVFVQDLYLRAPSRGMGAGRALLSAAMDHARDWSPSFMALMVNRTNTPALGFYQSLGFTQRDTADPYILAKAGLNALRIP